MPSRRRVSILLDEVLLRKARRCLRACSNTEAITKALQEAVLNEDVVPAEPARSFRGILRAKYSVKTLLRDRARERKRERARG